MVFINEENKKVYLVKDGDSYENDNYHLKTVLNGKVIFEINKTNKFKMRDLIEEDDNIVFFRKYFDWTSELSFLSKKMMNLKLEKGLFDDFEFRCSNGRISLETFKKMLKEDLVFLNEFKSSREDVENTFALTCC